MFIFSSCNDMPPFPISYDEPIKVVAIEEVEKPKIVNIYIDPQDVIIEVDTNHQFSVISVYADKSEEDVTNNVDWHFNTMGLGLIIQEGYFASIKEGELIIAAKYEGMIAYSVVNIVSSLTK
jgi:hypothetical protein